MNFIKGAIKHPGALHKSLGVPQGQKIPAGKLEKAAHSSDPTTRRRANLAKTLRKLHRSPRPFTADVADEVASKAPLRKAFMAHESAEGENQPMTRSKKKGKFHFGSGY